MEVYKVTSTYLKHGSTQEDGDYVTMTVHEILVDYITDDLYTLVKSKCTKSDL